MRILIPIYEIQDYGGIIDHAEFMVKGLEEAGHHCEAVILRDNDQPPYLKPLTRGSNPRDSCVAAQAHLTAGWYGIPIYSYGSVKRVEDFLKFARGFDYIIWELPCPYSPRSDTWELLYDSGVPQVACIHDAHFPKLYPHFSKVARKLRFVAPVNDSAFISLKEFPGAVKRIYNGHPILDEGIPWADRENLMSAAHVWKAWKHMDHLVRVAPLLNKFKLALAGDGIERRYMASPTKCPTKYSGIWGNLPPDTYKGILTREEVYRLYGSSKFMIDFSWNLRFNAYGSHFNRSVIEALNCGAVPTVTTLNGGGIFKDIAIHLPHTDSPGATAAAIDNLTALTADEANERVQAGRELLKEEFDYRKVCLEYLKL